MSKPKKNIHSRLKKRTVEQRARDLIDMSAMLSDGMPVKDIIIALNKTRPYTLSRAQVYQDIVDVRANWKNTAIANYEERRAKAEEGYEMELHRALVGYKKSCTRKNPSGDPRFLAVAVRVRDLMARMNDLYPRQESIESAPISNLPAGIIVIPGYSPEKPAPELPPDIKQIIDIPKI